VVSAYESASGPSPEPVEPPFSISGFDTDLPIVAVSIHSGHALRPEVATRLALPKGARLREEDPYLDGLTDVTDARVVVHVSRFEVDLNRPPARAVYLSAEDAWGLPLWKERPGPEVVERSLTVHRRFYEKMERLLGGFARRFRRFVVLDLHSYNHRRQGASGACTDPRLAPEINLGTGTLDRARWAPVVDSFMRDLGRAADKDVRENVCFEGGYFPAWVHRTFPGSACALAIEMKKTFMDEWTGTLDAREFERLHLGLAATLPGLVSALSRVP
jgi:N-formylglutamate amidohydrolase